MTATARRLAPVLLALALAACAGSTLEQAHRHLHEGRPEEALALLESESKRRPEDLALRMEYLRQRDLVIAQWLARADTQRLAGQTDQAEMLYRRAQAQDPANERARNGLALCAAERRHRDLAAAADKLIRADKHAEAQELLRPVLAENPQQREARRLQRQIEERLQRPSAAAPLKSSTTKPISLELRDVGLRAAFDVLQRVSGINFVFDRDVRGDLRVTVAVRETSVEDALRVLLLSNQLEHKVVNETTVLVFPNTPAKRREYQELVVRSFYLANADVKQTANMIRTVVKTRDIFIDEKINLLVIKDTPSAVQLAERLIAAQDLADPEVMLEVEVLEVSRNKLLELGLRYPSSAALGVQGAAGVPGTVSLREWRGPSADIVQLSFTDPMFLLSLRQEDGTTSVLANPRIRVKNREKARVHIGDRVPVITTTAAASGGFVSESVSYLDVGLKLEVEPLIHLEDEVGIKVALEVSNISREVKNTGSNTLAYQIGTRNAATVLRLRDGETQILAGLINDEDRRSANRVPGLGELPVLGRLFSSTRDVNNKSEIVLLITPRLVRTLARPEARALEFSAGTEASTGAVGGAPPFSPLAAPPPESIPTPPVTPVTPPVTPPASAPGQPQPGQPPMVPFGGARPPGQ